MKRMNAGLPITLCATLLISGCGKQPAPATPVAPSAADKAHSSTNEYKAGLDEYAAGRYPLAVGHFIRAAQQGNADAQYYTGLLYGNGEGVEQSWREAAKWYQKAADQNQPDAVNQLARLYVTGVGVGKVDLQKGLDLFGRAAQLYPPGEKRDQALQQKDALTKAMEANQSPQK